jgi:hypothetical protein
MMVNVSESRILLSQNEVTKRECLSKVLFSIGDELSFIDFFKIE